MLDFVYAFILIFIAEMGDKTQILAMDFATRYKSRQILSGLALGATLNHGMAILIGLVFARIIPSEPLQLITGLLYIAFGLLSLSIADANSKKVPTIGGEGPVMTSAVAFFIGELGDKTQLTAMTLGAQAVYPVFTLIGTVSGLVVVSLLGIYIGGKWGEKIPEYTLRFITFVVFMLFGLNKIFVSSYVKEMGNTFVALLVIIITILTVLRFLIFKRQIEEVSQSALIQKAKKLNDYRFKVNCQINEMCLQCDQCQNQKCLVGYMKHVLDDNDQPISIEPTVIESFNEVQFDKRNAKKVNRLLEEYFEKHPDQDENQDLRKIKNIMNQFLLKNKEI